MLEFDKETKEFVAQLKQSHIYLEYLTAKEEAIKDENLWNRIMDYRRNRFDMSSILNGREIYDRIEIFERDYADLYDNEIARNYLDAELALCRLLQDISLSLVADLDF